MQQNENILIIKPQLFASHQMRISVRFGLAICQETVEEGIR